MSPRATLQLGVVLFKNGSEARLNFILEEKEEGRLLARALLFLSLLLKEFNHLGVSFCELQWPSPHPVFGIHIGPLAKKQRYYCHMPVRCGFVQRRLPPIIPVIHQCPMGKEQKCHFL